MLTFMLGMVFGWMTLTCYFMIYVYFSLKKQNEEFEEWKETIRKPPELKNVMSSVPSEIK